MLQFWKGESGKMFEKVRGKKIGIYLRKEEQNEDLNKNGLGRLKWLEFELECNSSKSNIYIDEIKQTEKLNQTIKSVERGDIEVLVIWSVEDIDENRLVDLVRACKNNGTTIVSFCESEEWVNILSMYIQKYRNKIKVTIDQESKKIIIQEEVKNLQILRCNKRGFNNQSYNIRRLSQKKYSSNIYYSFEGKYEFEKLQ